MLRELEQALVAVVNESEGGIQLDGDSFVLLHRGAIAELQKGMEEILGRGAESILVRAGYVRGHALVQKLSSLVGDSEPGLVDGLRTFSLRTGLGTMQDTSIEPSRITIHTSNNFIAEGYGRGRGPVCHYLRGFFLAAGEHLLHRRDLACVERVCRTMGDPRCVFVVAPLPGSLNPGDVWEESVNARPEEG